MAATPLARLLRAALGRFDAARNRARVRASLQHVAGPKRFYLDDHEVALILVGRNVAPYLQRFHDHHRALGARYFVYLDNGSRDGSARIAAALPETIVVTSNVNFRDHEAVLRLFATTLFARGGWRLAVDADEMFDYPGSAALPLPELTRRLAARRHTAVVAQMLDMVPAGALPADLAASYDVALRACDSYSLDRISAVPYRADTLDWGYYLRQNRLTSENVQILFGGIRKALFGEDCCLTKHPLFRMGPGVVPLPHPHVSTGLTVSDFTALIRHYKFSGDFLERERALLAEGRVAHNETAQRLAVFADQPAVDFSVPGMGRDPTPEGLLQAGFLVAAPEAHKMLGI